MSAMTDDSPTSANPTPQPEHRELRSLLVEHLPALTGFVKLRAGQKLLARESIGDIAQSICGDMLADAHKFDYRGLPEFRALLFRYAAQRLANKGKFHARDCRDLGREVQGGQLEEDGVAQAYASICTPSRAMASREAIETFEAAFAQLPEDHREAIALRRLGGLDYEEIAAQLGRSVGATRNLVYRGLARLARILDY